MISVEDLCVDSIALSDLNRNLVVDEHRLNESEGKVDVVADNNGVIQNVGNMVGNV